MIETDAAGMRHEDLFMEESIMSMVIRAMVPEDKEKVVEMMRVFYASDAIDSNGSEEIFSSDVDNCVGDSPYLEGYVFEEEGQLQGYSMVAKSFATEFGRPCMWIEDLYIREEYRGQKIGSRFLEFIGKKYPQAVLRIEVEDANKRAICVYEKCGFRFLPYMEMKKDQLVD